jgi:hypothetical protein
MLLDRSKFHIGFSQGSSFIAKTIMKFTESKYSHSVIAYHSAEWDGWVALGADEGGWMLTPLEGEHLIDIYSIPQILPLHNYRGWLGSSYDIGGLLGMSWVEVNFHLLHRQVHNPLNARRSWFCSEIITQILEDSGMKLGLVPGDTDPQMLRNALVQRDDVFRITEPVFA